MSPQEKLMAIATKRSFGAAFLYVSVKYFKGKKNKQEKEAADLAWACNNIIIFFYMTEEKKEPFDGIDNFGRTVEGAISHNIKQARRWLNLWRAGYTNFKGRNAHQSCDFAHDQFNHILVVSIISHNGIAMYHADHTQSLGVTICATIPQEFLQELTKIGGTCYDLLCLLNDLKEKKNILSEAKALQMVSNLQKHAIRISGIAQNFPYYLMDQDLALIVKTIIGMRLRSDANKPQNFIPMPIANENIYTDGHILSIFNDFSLSDTYTLINLVCFAKKEIESVPAGEKNWARQIIKILHLGNYEFIVSISSTICVPEYTNTVTYIWNHEKALNPSNPPVCLLIYLQENSSIVLIDASKKHPSNSEQLLDKIYANTDQ